MEKKKSFMDLERGDYIFVLAGETLFFEFIISKRSDGTLKTDYCSYSFNETDKRKHVARSITNELLVFSNFPAVIKYLFKHPLHFKAISLPTKMSVSSPKYKKYSIPAVLLGIEYDKNFFRTTFVMP